ncbi:sulfur carrier protein ThiS [Rummeliibacillus stabekisii]|uniref:sulfur carrier protein ThiS n=1 Tax=Rummeliibacillus stabekisii TaxID=241244 RepID=UPI001167E9D2|nr:sulfur carrier protein ThiS [Rummeliibacillus stabekisii]MBB5170743.1 sulfur carrier protein [Rummeliibacillus stabekisii]GEL06237.1 sulfur carrier protein ThiS [Rummeliibacillus stabekisii]
MRLQINGESLEIPEQIRVVSDVIHHFGLESKVFIMELNHNILDKSRYFDTAVSDGDKIEIVHFVGGG